LKITIVPQKFRLLFPWSKLCIKNVFGLILGDIFTNSSGHPALLIFCRFTSFPTSCGSPYQGCQIVYFKIKNTTLGNFWTALLLYFMAIFFYFKAIWYTYLSVICIFSSFGILYQEKSGIPAPAP
jgi:hypothetical protein